MSEPTKAKLNPFKGISVEQREQLHNWYQDQISAQLSTLLKNSKSGKILDDKLNQALSLAIQSVVSNPADTSINANTSTIRLKNANVLDELKNICRVN